jgi:hypothetical protein
MFTIETNIEDTYQACLPGISLSLTLFKNSTLLFEDILRFPGVLRIPTQGGLLMFVSSFSFDTWKILAFLIFYLLIFDATHLRRY